MIVLFKESVFRQAIAALAFAAALAACTSRQTLEDAPIITSATYQHTLYNGRGQAIEASASKEGAPPVVITYFHSEEDLYADRDGSSEPPAEVGSYYVRIRRPAGNGYRAGKDITVEYHIQKALVTITADQNVEPRVVYYHVASVTQRGASPNRLQVAGPGAGSRGFPLSEPPRERGVYLAVISYDGDAHHMGASKEVELVIRN
jgi:hypothetical protein